MQYSLQKRLNTVVLLFILTAISVQAHEKNSLKTTFLSFATGSAKLTYERATVPKQSLELTGGVIGVGFDKFDVNPKGGLFRAAYKFILTEKSKSPLNGLYVRPEYAVSIFDYDSENSGRINSSMHTLLANAGYQWVMGLWVFDGFVGAGVGIGEPTELQYHHGFIDRFGWLTLTFGMRIGVAF